MRVPKAPYMAHTHLLGPRRDPREDPQASDFELRFREPAVRAHTFDEEALRRVHAGWDVRPVCVRRRLALWRAFCRPEEIRAWEK